MNHTFSHLFENLPPDAQKIVNDFDDVVQSVRPLSSKQFLHLPEDIRGLSHRLTDERSRRRAGYLNETAALTAYVRYFQWWNLVRLTRLFAGLGEECFSVPDDGVCLDVGSGPLTVPIALWLARPELRAKKLTWYCLDYSQNALAFGEDMFLAVAARTIAAAAARTGTAAEVRTVAARTSASSEPCGEADAERSGGCPWKIVRVKGELGTQIRRRADFISCANMFNEAVQLSGKPPEFTAKKAAAELSGYAAAGARIFVVEPGIPPAARFLFALRDALFRKNCTVLAPCPRGMQRAVSPEAGTGSSCPMDARRGGKWCHFVFAAECAPAKLLKLSAVARLPKERAALSFLLVQTESAGSSAAAGRAAEKCFAVNRSSVNRSAGTRSAAPAAPSGSIELRVASDPIRLPGGRTGYYACSRLGLTLAVERPAPSQSQSSDTVRPRAIRPATAPNGSGRAATECAAVTRPAAACPVSPVSGDLIDAPLPKYVKTDAKSGAVVVDLA